VDADHIVELFAAFGPVTVRRMFGGAGIYAEGAMFAIVADGMIYLKADGRTIPDFEREGLKPFTYVAKGRRSVALPYWRLPDRLYDDPIELAQWARAALMVAQRSPRNAHRGRQSKRSKSRRR
jgi:DNA transformation protein and related proteins